MAAIDDVRGAPFWLRELTELATDHGSTTSKVVRERQAAFLAAYARRYSKTLAAAEIQATIGAVDRWISEDPIFSQAMSRAGNTYSELLIDEATRRASEGIDAVIRDRHGAVVGNERRFSDPLLMFLLKGLDSKARWAQRDVAAGASREGAWRQNLIAMLGIPEAREHLEKLADMVTPQAPQG